MGLATAQTSFAPPNAFPRCSPQGHVEDGFERQSRSEDTFENLYHFILATHHNFPFQHENRTLQALVLLRMFLTACSREIYKTKKRKVKTLRLLLGWKMGFEPTTFGTTIRHSNRLSYIHHIDLESQIGVQI